MLSMVHPVYVMRKCSYNNKLMQGKSHSPMDYSVVTPLDTQNTQIPHTPLMRWNRTRHTFLR